MPMYRCIFNLKTKVYIIPDGAAILEICARIELWRYVGIVVVSFCESCYFDVARIINKEEEI